MHLRGLADGDDDHRGEGPEHAQARAQAAQGLGGASPRRGLAGQEQFPAPGVLLAPQEPGRGEQAPDGAEHHEEHEALPDRVPGHRLDPVRRAIDGRQAGVAGEKGGDALTLAGGLVGRGITQGGGGHGEAEHVAPQHPRPGRPAGGTPGDDRSRVADSRQGRALGAGHLPPRRSSPGLPRPRRPVLPVTSPPRWRPRPPRPRPDPPVPVRSGPGTTAPGTPPGSGAP